MKRGLTELLSAVKQVRLLNLVYAPNVDSIYTASLLLRYLKELDVDVVLTPAYVASRAEGAIVVGVNVVQRIPMPGVKFLPLEDCVGKDPSVVSSLALHLLRGLKSVWMPPKFIEALALASMVTLARWSLYDEKLFEVHKALIEETVSPELWDYVSSVRLFGYPKRELAQALERTIDPYIVGVSLDPSGSRERAAIALQHSSREEGVRRLVEELSRALSSYARSPPPLMGNKLVLKDVKVVEDVYEAAYALIALMDYMGPEVLLYASLAPSLIEWAQAQLYQMLRPFKTLIEEAIKGSVTKTVIVRGVRLSIIDISSESAVPPLYTMYRVLRGLGHLEEVAVYLRGKEYLLPLQFLEPKWPPERELSVEKNYVALPNLQAVGECLRPTSR